MVWDGWSVQEGKWEVRGDCQYLCAHIIVLEALGAVMLAVVGGLM